MATVTLTQLKERVVDLAHSASEQGEFPVGALVAMPMQVSDALDTQAAYTILGEGYNQKEGTKDPTAHAEVVAIRQAVQQHGDWRLNGAVLVTSLEPCPMCLGAILQARVAHVVYLAPDLRWGACGSVMDFSNHHVLNHTCTVAHHPNHDVVALMKAFFKEQKKR